MILKIAWRNIWRNKRRSVIVLASIVVGVVMLIIQDGLSNGMIVQMLNNQIKMGVGHIQIHRDGFNDDKTVKNYIKDPAEIEGLLSDFTYSKRVLAQGLINSAYNSSGIMICGILPEMEKRMTNISSSIIEGSYITKKELPIREGSRFKYKQIVIGKKLAEKLGIKLGNKLSVMSNSPDGTRVSELFRVAGIFKTASSQFDKSIVFVHLENAQDFLRLGNGVHEFSILLKNVVNTENITNKIRSELSSKYEVLNYKQLLPLLLMQVDLYKQMLIYLNFIIGLALIFGIINVMLMSVFERIPEIGVLMSVGMRNQKIFNMILIEALVLGILGTIVGLVCGYLVYLPLAQSGINLSIFEQSLDSFGVGAIIYPKLSLDNFINLIVMMPVVAVIGAIYPAFKAIRLEPVTAIRHV